MDTSGLLGGNVNITVAPITVDTITVVKFVIGGFALIIIWGIVRFSTK